MFFKQPTPAQYATRNLGEARLLLLKALASREYADSIVSQKVTEIKRLEKFLEDLEAKKVPVQESAVKRRVFSVLKPKQIEMEVKNVAA